MRGDEGPHLDDPAILEARRPGDACSRGPVEPGYLPPVVLAALAEGVPGDGGVDLPGVRGRKCRVPATLVEGRVEVPARDICFVGPGGRVPWGEKRQEFRGGAPTLAVRRGGHRAQQGRHDKHAGAQSNRSGPESTNRGTSGILSARV